ncbi:histidine phosphatase family protein [Staphylococcus sp. NAM3COL9]|uniref:histidine phosphatase family protein n=1 Tax=Staphylococcus sp. NAM3COL9 TaxID=1667172 RepID=UPI00070DB1A6|nr:histidine phosphatase family protein [Staphylococcus sp. NAM3COL9]KRG10989.1 phosphatase [Staphylococcus sp. NAM3COL9]
MTEICFIRHGETDWNIAGKLQGRTDVPLNHTGVKQAEVCSQILNNSEWDIIITSPLARAKKTADIIQQQLTIPLIEMDAFIEISFGDAEGLSLKERIALYPNRLYPNKEQAHVVTNRFLNGINSIIEQYKDQKILIVSHGAFIKAVFSYYSNGEISTDSPRLSNGSLSTLKLTNEQATILNYNEAAHLPSHSSLGKM